MAKIFVSVCPCLAPLDRLSQNLLSTHVLAIAQEVAATIAPTLAIAMDALDVTPQSKSLLQSVTIIANVSSRCPRADVIDGAGYIQGTGMMSLATALFM